MAYINTVTLEYPIQERDILEKNPNISFGLPFVAPEEYKWVFPTPVAYDSLTQGFREIAPVLTEKGHWEQQWEVYELDPEIIAANQAIINQQKKEMLISQIIGLQQKGLRCLIEDAPDTTWLDTYKQQIADLRDQIAAL